VTEPLTVAPAPGAVIATVGPVVSEVTAAFTSAEDPLMLPAASCAVTR
jgi:hypothetical protein